MQLPACTGVRVCVCAGGRGLVGVGVGVGVCLCVLFGRVSKKATQKTTNYSFFFLGGACPILTHTHMDPSTECLKVSFGEQLYYFKSKMIRRVSSCSFA